MGGSSGRTPTPLTPNWKHLPIGYHGRSGTVVVSGTDVSARRASARHPPTRRRSSGPPVRLDIEAEVGFVVGVALAQGSSVTLADFREHVSASACSTTGRARDIQAWEYVPLGPFLGKSFATSVSAWVTPLDALDAARIAPPPATPRCCPTWTIGRRTRRPGPALGDGERPGVSQPPFAGMYWTAAQHLAHMTVNGASLRTGDLFGSGTVSGPAPDQRGSLLELTWNGTEPLELPDGKRTFLEDGDEVTLAAWAPGADGTRVGLGEVTGRIVPTR